MSERLTEFAAAQAKAQRIKTATHVALRVDLHLNLGKDIVTAAKDTECDPITMAIHVLGVEKHIFASHAAMSVFVVNKAFVFWAKCHVQNPFLLWTPLR
ncbi:MAG: hypothetical protein OSA94_01750 [Yoonia sp.]|nr:hypothetical protein [Yoonia sp.]